MPARLRQRDGTPRSGGTRRRGLCLIPILALAPLLSSLTSLPAGTPGAAPVFSAPLFSTGVILAALKQAGPAMLLAGLDAGPAAALALIGLAPVTIWLSARRRFASRPRRAQ